MVLRRRFFRSMFQTAALVTGVLCSFAPDRALSTQEAILPWSSFNIQSVGRESSGPITLAGTQDASGELTSLKVKAFGRDFVLSRTQLRDLQQKPFAFPNGLQLTYAHDHEEGRALYVRLSTGVTSGEKASNLLTLPETGDIAITKVKARP